MQILGAGFILINTWCFQLSYIKPLHQKRKEQDDVIKTVKHHMVRINGENIKEFIIF